eukprot:7474078-Alexandrium_andersonii.AAC.1
MPSRRSRAQERTVQLERANESRKQSGQLQVNMGLQPGIQSMSMGQPMGNFPANAGSVQALAHRAMGIFEARQIEAQMQANA